MNDFELAMQEFLDNGGKVETLAYRGPSAAQYHSAKRTDSHIRGESLVIDAVVKEDFEGLEAH